MVTRVLVGALAIIGLASAAELAVQSVSISPGQSKEIEIRFNAEGSQTTGLQFDLGFDAEILKIAAAPGAAATAAGKSVVSSELGRGKRRFIVAGLNRDAISDGVVVRLTVSVSDTSKAGDVVVGVDYVSGTDRDAKRLPVTARSGVVSVVAGRVP
jgi:hypothetical protein